MLYNMKQISHLVIIEEDTPKQPHLITLVQVVNQRIHDLGWRVLDIKIRNNRLVYIMGVPFPEFCANGHAMIWYHEGQGWGCTECAHKQAIQDDSFFESHGYLPRDLPF